MSKEPEQCSNCRFSHVVYGHQCTQWMCRKRAPLANRVAPNGCIVNYPPTEHRGWCGDYEAKDSNPQPQTEPIEEAFFEGYADGWNDGRQNGGDGSIVNWHNSKAKKETQ